MQNTLAHAIFIAIVAGGCGSVAGLEPSANPTETAGIGGASGSGEVQPAIQPAPSASAPAATPASQTPNSSMTAPTVGAIGIPAPTSNVAAVPGNMVPPMGAPPAAPGGPISAACRGFDFDQLVYSPGGSVLPNKCEAFHPTLNNPYVVRCVDAWPWFRTQYPGDNFCVLPPPPDKGVQIGHHPHGEYSAWFDAVSKGDMSGYDKVPAEWILEAGLEEERNINIRHSNPAGKFDRIYARMRGGSHHMIASTTEGASQFFTWGPGGADGLWAATNLPTAQRPDDNLPNTIGIAAEDVGLYTEFAANATVVYNMHHFNSTDRPILREAWQNIWWTDKATTRITSIVGLPPLQVTMAFANPGEIVDFHYATTGAGSFRVISLYGHRHAWTTAFSAWIERTGKEPQILYQSFDWFNEPTFTYNSQATNPTANATTRADGGSSGVVMINAGEKLHFNCHIEYTDERAKQESSPVTPAKNGPLRFANQAFNAEMCILFGTSVGNIGTLDQLGAPPDFAKVR